MTWVEVELNGKDMDSLLDNLNNVDVVLVRKHYHNQIVTYKIWKPTITNKELLRLWFFNIVYENWKYIPVHLIKVEICYDVTH